MSRTLYDRIVMITEDYLGPATPRFLNRIAMNHIGKPASKLDKADLQELITWVQLAANVLTENRSDIDALITRLQALSDSSHKANHGTNRNLSTAQ